MLFGRQKQAKTPSFRQCPGCSYDFITGDGSRSCNYFDCPYLPEDLKVFCPECNYNFATAEGDHWCDDLSSCRWAEEGLQRAAMARKAFGA